MSGNIFDNMSDEAREFSGDDSASNSPGNEGVFTIQFWTEHVNVVFRSCMTINDAFIMNADFLGFDSDRLLAYRDNRANLLYGNESPEAGMVYTASITHDEKG